MATDLIEKDGVNNIEGLTDKETQLVGISMYLGFNSDEELDILEMNDRDYSRFVDDGYENASGEAMKMRSEYRDGINGTWNREVFDGFADDDEDFDSFLTKRARKRRKVRKKLRKEGMSRKDARKEALKQVERGKIGKALAKVGKKIGKGIKAVGRAVVVGTMAIPRGAYLLLMRINYRGLADKTAVSMEKPEYAEVWKKVKDKWYKLGGKVDALEKAVRIGKGKKPKLCGKKCKLKIAKKVGSSFTGADGSVGYKLDKNKFNREMLKMYEASIDEGVYSDFAIESGTALAIGSATAIIGTMAQIMSGVKGNKIQEQALKDAQEETNRQNAEFERMASEKQKEELRLAEEQIKAQANPKNAIMNNPDLSPEEKKEALEVLDESLAVEEKTKSKKWITYAIIGAVALVGLGFVMRKK